MDVNNRGTHEVSKYIDYIQKFVLLLIKLANKVEGHFICIDLIYNIYIGEEYKIKS